jgi:hypothetical protein
MSKRDVLSCPPFPKIIRMEYGYEKMFAGNWSEGITLKELFEQFLVAKQCVNVSPYTLEYYRGCYNSFTRIAGCWRHDSFSVSDGRKAKKNRRKSFFAAVAAVFSYNNARPVRPSSCASRAAAFVFCRPV